MLLPLLIAAARQDMAQDARRSGPCAAICRFCGGGLGLHAGDEGACALCVLVRHLDRPRIDAEATLIWLPEMSQAALVCLVRELHTQSLLAGERPDGKGGAALVTVERSALHFARGALAARGAVAAEHLGSERPSELAQVLTRLSVAAYGQRRRLLGGLRLLPSGRFFIGSDDVYPAIVESWRTPSTSQTSTGSAV
jgi:hypothetical protein